MSKGTELEARKLEFLLLPSCVTLQKVFSFLSLSLPIYTMGSVGLPCSNI